MSDDKRYVVWATRGEWSDRQSKIACRTNDAEEAARFVVKATELDAKLAAVDRYHESWTYTCHPEIAPEPAQALATLTQELLAKSKCPHCSKPLQKETEPVIFCEECSQPLGCVACQALITDGILRHECDA